MYIILYITSGVGTCVSHTSRFHPSSSPSFSPELFPILLGPGGPSTNGSRGKGTRDWCEGDGGGREMVRVQEVRGGRFRLRTEVTSDTVTRRWSSSRRVVVTGVVRTRDVRLQPPTPPTVQTPVVLDALLVEVGCDANALALGLTRIGLPKTGGTVPENTFETGNTVLDGGRTGVYVRRLGPRGVLGLGVETTLEGEGTRDTPRPTGVRRRVTEAETGEEGGTVLTAPVGPVGETPETGQSPLEVDLPIGYTVFTFMSGQGTEELLNTKTQPTLYRGLGVKDLCLPGNGKPYTSP